MRLIRWLLSFSLFCCGFTQAATGLDNTQLAVWANEAIVGTYSYNYKNFIQRQREIAVYFSATGWTSYSAALNTSQLPDTVQKNQYDVSAVAQMPPEIKSIAQGKWQAVMPLLVVYKNPQYQQKQTLEITLQFSEALPGQGVRHLAIEALQAKVIKPPCQCSSG